MIYVDTSVLLGWLLAEDRSPPEAFWDQPLVASRLLQYEAWVRLHARGVAASHGDALRAVLDRLFLVELSPVVLARALEPFPVPLRTLDALHVATALHLRDQGLPMAIATYDDRLGQAARALRLPVQAP